MTHLARRNSPPEQVVASAGDQIIPARHLHGQGTSGATNVVLQATTGHETPGLDEEQVTDGQRSPDQGPSGEFPVVQGTPGQSTTEQAPRVQVTVQATVHPVYRSFKLKNLKNLGPQNVVMLVMLVMFDFS